MKTLQIEKEVLPIWKLINESIKPFYIQARERGLKMIVDLPIENKTNSPRNLEIMKELCVIGDQIKLCQVFRNVVSNALKFSLAGTVVKIVAQWKPDELLDEGKLCFYIFLYFFILHVKGLSLLKEKSDLEAAGVLSVSVEDSGPGLFLIFRK
jgi:signal transduction histidine kinase